MNNKRFFTGAALACLAMLSQYANAARGFEYSYGEFGVTGAEAVSGDGAGFKIDFSFGATDYVNVLGEYSRLFGTDDVAELDGQKFSDKEDIDRDEFKIGLGVHYPVTDGIDVTFSALYVDQEFTGDWVVPFPPAGTPTRTNVNVSEEGYEAELGARVRLFKKFEITPHAVYRDIGADSNTGGGLGLVYNFHKKFSVSLKGTFFSDNNENNGFAGIRLDL